MAAPGRPCAARAPPGLLLVVLVAAAALPGEAGAPGQGSGAAADAAPAALFPSSGRVPSAGPGLAGPFLPAPARRRVCGEGCCAGPARSGSAVAAFCANRTGAALRGRCCLDGSPRAEGAVVVGLDLGNCSLHRLCSSFQEASTAFIIDLSDNPLERLPQEAFRGFSHLETLVLPSKLDCPGGSEGWISTSLHGSSRVCQGQRNPCNGSTGMGWLCPEDSLCAPDGPGLPQCLCVSPFHGYKCLRQGAFPYLLFFGALGAVTTALSLLLWITQRRKAKTT